MGVVYAIYCGIYTVLRIPWWRRVRGRAGMHGGGHIEVQWRKVLTRVMAVSTSVSVVPFSATDVSNSDQTSPSTTTCAV